MLHRVWEVWRNLKLFTRPLIDAKHLQYVAFIFSSFLFTFIWDFWRGLYTCHDICVKVKGQLTGVCSMLHCGSNSSCQPWPLGASTSWATLMTLFSCVCVEWVHSYVCICVHLYVHIQQPEEDIGSPACHSSLYYFETGSLSGPGARLSTREPQQSYCS